MRKTLTLEDLKDIKTNSYRRIVIFSDIDLDLFKNNAFQNYIELKNMENIMKQYLTLVKNTEKNMPYLFIFNCVVPDNEEFFESSNWIILRDER